MSSYQMGAFEALQWLWHQLRSYRGSPTGVDDARRIIEAVLVDMGRGEVDFAARAREAEACVVRLKPMKPSPPMSNLTSS